MDDERHTKTRKSGVKVVPIPHKKKAAPRRKNTYGEDDDYEPGPLYVPPLDINKYKGKTADSVSKTLTRLAAQRRLPTKNDVVHQKFLDFRAKDGALRTLRHKLKQLVTDYTNVVEKINQKVGQVELARNIYDKARVTFMQDQYAAADQIILESDDDSQSEGDNDDGTSSGSTPTSDEE